MANAHLHLSQELSNEFQNAQSGNIRFIKSRIQDEHFVFTSSGVASENTESDLEGLCLSPNIVSDEACFVLYCPNASPVASFASSKPLKWILIAFVPENSSVRERMLYSSARDSLKRQLGFSHFVAELHATETSEITAEAITLAKERQLAMDAPLSEKERVLKEDALLARDTNVKSSAMNAIPFEMTENLREKLQLFQNEKFDWLTMKINVEGPTETVDVVKSLKDVEALEVADILDAKAPSFVAYRLTTSDENQMLLFLYVCPEDVPVRQKMIYSTCKSTLLATARTMGIHFAKMIEINDIHRAVEDIQAEMDPLRDFNPKEREFSRPTAPGRGSKGPRGRQVPYGAIHS
uniref:Twinfilinlike protein putative n=1 Tax=Albugo laibachii Nc14 TaxID=890382 RepID=F0WHZ6_9STRA|nr:twinfilinlike protein putative [Albugo laibachii Nc14]|eukprot:CCA20873.1 twinfilinlike protein putative [Albugo laibachii Nc14]